MLFPSRSHIRSRSVLAASFLAGLLWLAGCAPGISAPAATPQFSKATARNRERVKKLLEDKDSSESVRKKKPAGKPARSSR
jgi:hypothetical protein